MPETPTTIREWADATFGPRTPQRALARAHAEMSELLLELTGPADPARLLNEAADVAITLCACPWQQDHWPEAQKTSELLFCSSIRRAARFIAEAMTSYNNAHMQYRTQDAEWELALAFGPALWPEAERKMAINRARTWTRDGFGTGQHQEESVS